MATMSHSSPIMNDTPETSPYALVVEADPDKRKILIEIACDLDLRCLEAQDGQEAVNQIRSQLPAIIIMNMTVPDAELVLAFETRKEIPALNAIPVVALSAFRPDAADWRGLRGLFPVGDTLHSNPEDLRALIKGALSSPF